MGRLRVDPREGLVEGPGGSEQLDPKVMAVFEALAAKAGELVTREELLDRIWADRVVTDDAVSRCIYQLRRQLVAAGGDDALHDVVETLPRRGYRLKAKVLPDAAQSGATRHRWRLAAVFAALALVAGWWIWQQPVGGPTQAPLKPDQPVVAVLPFVDLSEAGDQAYFADGVSEELINSLARIPSLRVIARSSTFQFKDRAPDIASVAEKLGATHVLEGAVRKDGDVVRISAQLIEAEDQQPIWSETYQRELDNVLAIQDEVARSVSAALQLSLSPAANERGAATPGAAYVHFLQGRRLFNRRGQGDLEEAASQYRLALEIDPDFARAWAGLAGVYMVQTFNGEIPEGEGIRRIRDAASRALELDPTDPEANFRMARAYRMQGDFEAAAPYWEAARRHGGNDPLILGVLATNAWSEREFDRAVALYRQAAAIDPLSTVARGNLAQALLYMGRLAESREEALAALALRPENAPGDRRVIGGTLVAIELLDGRADEALSLLEDWPQGHDERDMYTAIALDALGRQADADAVIRRMQGDGGALGAIRMAQVYSHRGDPDAAFDWLDVALARLDEGTSSVQRGKLFSHFHASPFLKQLHQDPRWQRWLEEFWMEPR